MIKSSWFRMGYVVAMFVCAFVHGKVGGPNKLLHIECDLAHKANAQEMQFGAVTFYFEREPVVHCVPSRALDNQVIYFFPQATFSSDMNGLLAKTFEKTNGDFVSLRCEKIKKPIEGVQVVVMCDNAQVAVDRSQVRSLQLKPGIMFSFYNKKLLNTVKNQTKCMLRLSYMHGHVYWPYLFV